MDIAGITTDLKAMEVGVKVATSVLKKTMDTQETIANDLINQLATLNVGASTHKVDIEI